METNRVFKEVTENSMQLLPLLGAVKAIGISGSYARATIDPLSDIDICVFADPDIPLAHVRGSAYQEVGCGEVIYFDVDFETSRGDGFRMDGVRCDFNWMSVPRVKEFLQRLRTDFGTPEYLPGGLMQVKEILDPDGVIAGLKAAIPVYSDERAQYRIKKAVEDLHFSYYELGWLGKAVYREDILLFFKYQVQTLDSIVQILFALNKAWLADEKGLIKLIGNFECAPTEMSARLNEIMTSRNDRHDLESAYQQLKELLFDIVQVALKRYPGLDLPQSWP